MTANTDERLRSLIDRIARLEEERAGIASDIRDIYAEGKSAGYDVKALRLVVKREREDAEKRTERERVEREAALMEAALGVLRDTPLGTAAMERHAA